MDAFLSELPKCEHHVHIEGTLEPELLFPLAARNNITLPASFPQTPEELAERYAQFKDLQEFLDYYYVAMSVLIHEQDFYDLAMAYYTKAAADAVHHTETFFDPQAHVDRGVPLEVVVAGLNRARNDALQKFPTMLLKLIMCLLRHLPAPQCTATVHAAAKYYTADNEHGEPVIHGLGLDLLERPFPPELFEELYAALRQHAPDAYLTAHLGEEGGPDYVTLALDVLGVHRIDHGVRLVEDEALLTRLAAQRTLLTVCPLSNVRLSVVQDVSEVPLRKLLEFDVPFSLNSDDPAYFGGYILDNYLAVQRAFDFDMATWVKIAKNGVHGLWVDDARKQQILAAIDEVHARHA